MKFHVYISISTEKCLTEGEFDFEGKSPLKVVYDKLYKLFNRIWTEQWKSIQKMKEK